MVIDGSGAHLLVRADGDISIELWGARRKRELFERVFDCHLDVTGTWT
jgi:hypothetical protein